MATHGRFYALLNQLPHADKEQLIFTASCGKTISLNEIAKDLRVYNNLLNDMQRMVDELKGNTVSFKDNEAMEAQKRRYRSIILGKFNEHGIVWKKRQP